MFVLTVDQQRSTSRGDKVPDLLARVAPVVAALPGVRFPFERTVGDEVQAVLDDPASTLVVVLEVIRMGGWRIGLGIGTVSEPLPDTSRAASGSAFIHARAAVDRAKGRTTAVPVAVESDSPTAGDVEALLRLVGAVVERRTHQGWEVVDLLRPDVTTGTGAPTTPGRTQKDVARILGISEQAVSQRVRSALWAEELAAWPLAARLLREADQWVQGRSSPS